MKVGDFDVPDDLKYTEKHQWAKVEGDNIRVGITDFAKQQLGSKACALLYKYVKRFGNNKVTTPAISQNMNSRQKWVIKNR